MTIRTNIRAKLDHLRREEPVAAIGTVSTVLIGTGTWIAAAQPRFDGVKTWNQFALVLAAYAIPAIATKLQRSKVYSPASAERIAINARATGVAEAKNRESERRRVAAIRGVETRKRLAAANEDLSVEEVPVPPKKQRVVKRPKTKKKLPVATPAPKPSRRAKAARKRA